MQVDPDSLNQWFTTNDDWLKKLTELVRGELSDLKRAIVAALITQDVHSRDIIDDLRKENCSSTYDFNW
jgi:dynein heavy chain